MSDEGSPEPLDTDGIILQFTDDIVAQAEALSRKTSLSAKEILEAAGVLVASSIERIRKRRKVSGWDIARREAKSSGAIDPSLLLPIEGKGYRGRPGFDGKLSQEVKKLYDDPDKKGEYLEKAKAENEQREEEEVKLEAKPIRQKKLLRKLRNLVSLL